jgi:hypothetical protein
MHTFSDCFIVLLIPADAHRRLLTLIEIILIKITIPITRNQNLIVFEDFFALSSASAIFFSSLNLSSNSFDSSFLNLSSSSFFKFFYS